MAVSANRMLLALLGLLSPLVLATVAFGQDAPAEVPKGVPAFLGVETAPGTGAGVAVQRVVPGGAAESVGVRVRDRILGLGGTTTDNTDELRAVISRYSAGDRAQLVFRRGNGLSVVEVVFGARPAAKERDVKLAPALEFLELEAGQVVADIGCGAGWLSAGMAPVVGLEGLVYAVDINATCVREMEERRIPNVATVHSKPHDVSLPENVLDQAVLHDVASHVDKEHRASFYLSIAKALKDEGRLIVFGPHGKARAMLAELAGFGFQPENADELLLLNDAELDARLGRGIRLVARAS